MRRRFLLLLLCVAAVSLILVPAALASSCTVGLYAGQDTRVGTVTVTPGAEGLSVVYHVGSAWRISEAHLAVAHDAANLPQTLSGAARPGQFAWPWYGWSRDVSFFIPYHEPCDPAPLVIAAHAVVKNVCSCESETAWAGQCGSCCGCDAWTLSFGKFTKGWATYFTITPPAPAS